MATLALQRCLNHPDREAAGRCVECGRSYCRECVTEHDERLICGSCLQKLRAKPERAPSVWPGRLARLASGGFGLFMMWLFFYAIGRLLLLIPSSYHSAFWHPVE